MVSEPYDFVLVSEAVWQQLHRWYGGGPEFGCPVISNGRRTFVEVRPLLLKVVRSSAMTQETHVFFSKVATLAQLKAELCRQAQLEPEKVRVWDWHGRSKLKQLDAPQQRQEDSLEDAQIIDNNYILLEEANADGTFPESSSSSSYGYSSRYGYGYGYGYSSSYGGGGSYGSGGPVEPGSTGLGNLGNTCFMNSALQCLNNVGPLTNFFRSRRYEADLNTTNPLGMRGELAQEYARLLEELWSGRYASYSPRDFKYRLERFAPQFSGYQQHDSQELLAFLLDGLHEDLNRVRVKPYRETREADGRPDEEVAREAWRAHLDRNDSIIVDLFQGQLKSTLVCPEPGCGRVSVTFDPFMYLSLPLRLRQTRRISLAFLRAPAADPEPQPQPEAETELQRVAVRVDKDARVQELRQALAGTVQLPPERVILTEVYNSRFFRLLQDADALDTVQDRDLLVAYEMPPPRPGETEEQLVHVAVLLRKTEQRISYATYSSYSYSYSYSSYYGSGAGSSVAASRQKTLFGLPFVLLVPRRLRFSELLRLLVRRLQRLLKRPPEELLAALLPPPPPQPEPRLTSAPPSYPPPAPPSSSGQARPPHTSASSTTAPTPDEEAQRSDGTQQQQEEQQKQAEEEEEQKQKQKQQQQQEQGNDTESTEGEAEGSEGSTTEGSEGGSDSSSEESGGEQALRVFEPAFRVFVTDAYGSADQAEVGREGPEAEVELVERMNLVLDWSDEAYARFYNEEAERTREALPAAGSGGRQEDEETVTLDHCLEMFTAPEQLGPEDPWYCNRCKEFRQATKKLDLWRLPPVLVVHLKRFSYRGRNYISRDKLDTFVDFPIEGLDLSRHVLGPLEDPEQPPIYDLIAVSNHYGSLGGGHYTAFARNPIDGRWRRFDDSYVTEVSPTAVRTEAAYVLFYQRRGFSLPTDLPAPAPPESAPADAQGSAAPAVSDSAAASSAASAATAASSSDAQQPPPAEPQTAAPHAAL
jgi:ubiquitin carboxyl-terminal hydrolase 4/11/15